MVLTKPFEQLQTGNYRHGSEPFFQTSASSFSWRRPFYGELRRLEFDAPLRGTCVVFLHTCFADISLCWDVSRVGRCFILRTVDTLVAGSSQLLVPYCSGMNVVTILFDKLDKCLRYIYIYISI